MNVFCIYNDNLDRFLKDVVQYTLGLYGEELNISKVEEIQLKSTNEFDYDTDGRTYDGGTKILVTSRLYDMLPCFEISKLKKNDEFLMIVNALFHEMGHATDWLIFPNMYYAATDFNSKKDMVTSLFWP